MIILICALWVFTCCIIILCRFIWLELLVLTIDYLFVIYHPKGWFNSLAGVVKRRFASYVKLHLANGSDNKEKERDRLDSRGEKVSATLPESHIPVSVMQPQRAHQLKKLDNRHRSPDPPPRYIDCTQKQDKQIIIFMNVYLIIC